MMHPLSEVAIMSRGSHRLNVIVPHASLVGQCQSLHDLSGPRLDHGDGKWHILHRVTAQWPVFLSLLPVFLTLNAVSIS